MVKTKKRPLTREDAVLLDRIIDRFNQLLLWENAWEVLGVVNTKRIETLEARFKKIREKEGSEYPRTDISEEYELNKKFFRELHDLLAKFAAQKGLGTEFDKRRAQQLTETALAYEKNCW